MRRATRSQPLGAILTVILLLALGGTARADDAKDEQESRTQRAREIITQVEKSDSEASWLRTHFRIRKKRGIEYRYPLTMGQREAVFSIYGPLVKKKRFGLGFELRF
jgi:hypothetical protein